MLYFLPVALPIAALVGATKLLQGANLKKYDVDAPATFESDPNAEHIKEINAYLYENFEKPAIGHSGGEPVATKRERFDKGGLSRKFPSTFTPLSIPSSWGNITGEWVQAKNADPDKRILYIHGGAFTVGSCYSHRSITSKLAELTGASVCAINYRLLPENKRMDSVEDCRTAYKWILENGPDGPFSASKLAVAGDSAGGNLTLSLSAWVRDQIKQEKSSPLRAPDAVVGISPSADSTFGAPSIRSNLATDNMLRPMVGKLTEIPRAVLLWGTFKQIGMSPSNPIISPIFGKLNDLPPTLIHVSTTEILYDDAVRYTTKANLAGSEVKLQTWTNMPHVWHIFDNVLPEADVALKEIAKFLKCMGI